MIYFQRLVWSRCSIYCALGGLLFTLYWYYHSFQNQVWSIFKFLRARGWGRDLFILKGNLWKTLQIYFTFLVNLWLFSFPGDFSYDLHHWLYLCCLELSSKWDNLVIHLNKCLLLSSDGSRLVDSKIYILCILCITWALLPKIKFCKQIEQTFIILVIPFNFQWQCES